MNNKPTRILFTGYAPVHFVCFLPLYLELIKEPNVEIFVSGGLREKSKDGNHKFHLMPMYRPFGIPTSRMLTMTEIANMDFDILFASNTKMLEPRSVKTKIQVFHGISFRNRAIRKENLGADHFFLAGPYMKRKFAAAGLLAENDPRGLDIGFLKTDRLANGTLDRDSLNNSFGFSGERPVLLYAPTGQKHCSLETMGVEFIEKIKASNKYDLLIKLHDHPHGATKNWQAEVAEMEDEHTRLAESFDVTPLLYMADLLITDASSVSSEYSLLNRPMVFLDVPKLLAKAAKKDDSMMDDDTWGRKGGVVVPDPDTALAAIEASLAHPEDKSDFRQAMADDLLFNHGRSVDEAMNWLRINFFSTKVALAS